MKKSPVIIAALICIVAIIVAAAVVEKSIVKSMPFGSTKDFVVYDKEGINLTYRELPPVRVISPAGEQSTEWFKDARINDGMGESMSFSFGNIDTVPFVQTANDQYIVVPIRTETGNIQEVFVADRSSRNVIHYSFPSERFFVSTHDVKKFILADEKSIVIRSPGTNDVKQIHNVDFSLAGGLQGASVSQDDTQVALLVKSGTMDEPKYLVYLMSLTDFGVRKIGEMTDGEELVWRDSQTVVNVVTTHSDGIEKKEQRETFSTK